MIHLVLMACVVGAFLAFAVCMILVDTCDECGARDRVLFNARVTAKGGAWMHYEDRHICYDCAYRFAVTGRLGAIVPDTMMLPEGLPEGEGEVLP